MQSTGGGLSAGTVSGPIHVENAYYGTAFGPAEAAASLPSTSAPLAVPQRRVRSDQLRGRDRLVAEVVRAVSRRASGDAGEPGVWLLTGMGGSGKTAVALEAAHRLTGAVTHAWWVSGEDGEGLSGALRAVAFAAGAAPSDFYGAHPTDVLWKHLEALTVPWLVVLDNIDEPAVLAAAPSRTAEGTGWLREPAHPRGTVLVTSRESRPERWGRWVHIVGVDPLSSKDGALVLRDLAWRAADPAQAEQLAEDLGGLPLALDLAGSYLARALDDPWPSPQMPATFGAYRRSLDANLAEMASDADLDLGPAARLRRAIPSTYELSLDLLHRQGVDLARPLLRLLSAFGPAPIPYQELLDVELLAASELFPHATLPRLKQALRGLAGLKLITIEPTVGTSEDSDAGAPTLTIHPMVRAASRDHADFTTHALAMLRLVTALLQRFTKPLEAGNPAHWPRWGTIAAHATADRLLLTAAESDGVADADLVLAATEPALNAARYHVYAGMFTEAISELKAVKKVRVRLLGNRNPDTITVGLNLAWALRDGGYLKESDQLYLRLADAAESLEPGHRHRQSVRAGWARTLAQLGRYEAAEVQLTEAHALRLRDPQTDRRRILHLRADLARLAHNQGRHDEAVGQLREVRLQMMELARPGDPDLLGVGLSLVAALRDAGQSEKAEALAEDVVAEHRRFLAPDHPDLLLARHEQARVLRDRGRGRESLERVRDEFSDIWRTSERRLGKDHPNTIAARHELATAWHLLGHPHRAAEHFRAALDAGTQRLGEHHPNVVLCARNLARVRAELGETAVDSEVGAAATDDSRQIQDPLRSGAPDPTSLTSAVAPSADHDHVDAPALARWLDRFVRADRTVAGVDGGGGGGYSSGSYDTSKPVSHRFSTYRPPSREDTEPDLFEREVHPVRLGNTAVHALATGNEDRPLIQRLRDQQLAARVLWLRELVGRAETAMAGHPDMLPAVGEVRALLIRADRADSLIVAEVLLDPSVGRWMSRTLRALNDRLVDLPSDDLAHLQSVAAAAAVRAGLAFDLRLPLRDGFALLPTLGAADLRAGKGTEARLHVREWDTYIARGTRHVPLHGRDHSVPRLWHPVHRVQTAPEAGRFDFVLDDLDPYRVPGGLLPPTPRRPAEAATWESLIYEAGSQLSGIDRQRADALGAALTALTPRPKESCGMVSSVSSSDAFGGIVVSEPPDGVELAASLVHEFQHLKLHALLDSVPLHDESDEPNGEAFYAPWRDEPRPLPGLFQGVFAFFGVVDYWRRLTLTAKGDTLRRAQFQLVHWRTQTLEAYTALRSSPRLTGTGRDFVRLMGDTTAAWTEHPAVPGDVMVLAEEAVVAHRTRWRLHHLRPDAAAVAELADAWTSGALHASPWSMPVALCPDPAAAPSHTYAALLCRVATAPAGPGLRDSEVDPSDFARLFGSPDEARRLAVEQVTGGSDPHESWVRLGLALRRQRATPSAENLGTDAAAFALTHRPELIRAVHALVAELTGAAPDLVALAAWIGAEDSTPDFPDLPKMDAAFTVHT
ncbi:aKG-HExxH-type peptide beta-hydroxylase [Streptomyces sp. NBC_01483]|uniref:aKG-HExxH-type peptide beta-hydroxylase n=1 Tax=Streptomyces sp. NBC_01483 TaxID=2903883 RepID=UPI002E313180|nr:HEXXH motif-containing putative peptide modification protein [Streptomyces sp. NBC_01483]